MVAVGESQRGAPHLGVRSAHGELATAGPAGRGSWHVRSLAPSAHPPGWTRARRARGSGEGRRVDGRRGAGRAEPDERVERVERDGRARINRTDGLLCVPAPPHVALARAALRDGRALRGAGAALRPGRTGRRPTTGADPVRAGRSRRQRGPAGLAGPGPGRPDGRLAVRVPARRGRRSWPHDFAALPATGITPVICGDAHLGNFGFYASPERELVFDLNDFDEAHPGALGVGPAPAGRQRLGGRPAERRHRGASAATPSGAASRRTGSRSRTWPSSRCSRASFERLDVDRLRRHGLGHGASARRSSGPPRRARRRTSDRALPRFTEQRDGVRRIVEEPPLITRPDDREQRALADGARRVPAHAAAALAPRPRRLPARRHRAQGRRRRLASGCGRTSRCARAAARTTCCSCSSSRPAARWSRRYVHGERGLARPPGAARRGVPAGAADGQRPAARLDRRSASGSTTCASSAT